MKVLFLSQGRTIEDHPGWHDALIQLKEQGEIKDFLNIPYFGYAEKYGWDKFYKKVVKLCKTDSYDLVYFHHYHRKGKPTPKECIINLKSLSSPPIIITSCGDPFSDNWMRPDYPKDFRDASRYSDITFSTQMGKAADKMMSWGANNIVFSPLGMCQKRFRSFEIDISKHKFDYSLTFIGSNNGGRRLFNPISKYWFGARKRKKLVYKLFDKYKTAFGLFGNGWSTLISAGSTEFDKQQITIRKGRVTLDAPPHSYSDYYMSNRPLFQMASAIPTIVLSVPRLNKIFRNKEHCYFVEHIDEVNGICESLLTENKKKLYEKSAAAAKYIEEKHTQYHRMKFKIDTVKRFVKNNHVLDVAFPFFLPEVDMKEEMKYATRSRNL